MVPGYPKEIILSTGPLGGCGDLSLYSTLPRRFATEGHEVYLHEDNFARNDEIIELWFGLNPFINGVSRLTPNAGYPNQGRAYDILNRLPLGSAIEGFERAHGFGPPYSLAPETHYKPKPCATDMSNVTLFDMHSLSSAIHEIGWARFHQKMTDRFGPLSLVTLPTTIAPPIEQPAGVECYGANSIFEYFDMLCACKAWCGSEAGGQALAAAARGEHRVFEVGVRPEVVSLMAPNTFNSRAFCFAGVDYRTSKYAAGEDYLEPVEVPYYRYHEVCKTNITSMRKAWRDGRSD